MRQRRALGVARRAARVLDVDRRRGSRGSPRARRGQPGRRAAPRVEELGPDQVVGAAGALAADRDHPFQRGQLVAHLGDHRQVVGRLELARGDQHPHTGVSERVGELVGAVGGVDVDEDRSDPCRARTAGSVHSAQLGAQIPTRSPGSTSSASRPRATVSTESVSSAQVWRTSWCRETRATAWGRSAATRAKSSPTVSRESSSSVAPAACDVVSVPMRPLPGRRPSAPIPPSIRTRGAPRRRNVICNHRGGARRHMPLLSGSPSRCSRPGAQRARWRGRRGSVRCGPRPVGARRSRSRRRVPRSRPP